MRVETGVPGFTDLWGPAGHRTDGNLKGITASLDYIKELGFNAIWLTPVFDTHNGKGGEKLQATGYFATDYFNIDPRFGTNEEFKELVDEAHRRGIYILLDLVAGHHGENPAPSPNGNKIDWKEDTPNDLGMLPGNVAYPGSLPFFKEVIRFWMDKYAVDGWRLDQCYQVSQGGHNYWKELREEAETVATERKARGEQWGTLAYMVGEDWNAPQDITTTRNDGLRSVFDFDIQNYIVWLPGGVNDIIKAYSDPTLRGYEKNVITNLFVGNHDMGRIGSKISDVRQLLFRYTILAAYSGPVTFFYNDEFAVTDGDGNPDNMGRVSGRLEAETADEQWLKDNVAKIFNIRKNHPAMWRGTCDFISRNNILEIIKTDPVSGEKIVIVMPLADGDRTFPENATDMISGNALSGKQRLKANTPVIYQLPSVDTKLLTDLPKADKGKIERHIIFSPQLGDSYIVDVWLPEGYSDKRARSYPVVYAQDGQNLYDAAVTWNGQCWDVDGKISRLGDAIDAPVVVGIHNNPTRFADYTPQKPLASKPELAKKVMTGWNQTVDVRSDSYLDFIVSNVKPIMEQKYNIRKDASGVAAMGSSMGGLISLYAMCEYPQQFGTALCLSTHWPGLDATTVPEFPQAILDYLTDRLPADGIHKLYLDHGTKGFDALYEPWNGKAYEIALAKGYRADETAMAYIDPEGDHNEASWRSRLEKPLMFAFGAGELNIEPEDVKVYLYYEGATENDTFYTFIYNDTSTNAEWPGVPMQYIRNISVNGVSADRFVYSVPESFIYDGLTMVTDNGTRRYPGNMEPGIPLNGRSLSFVYKDGTWTTEYVSELGGLTAPVDDKVDFSRNYEIYNLNGVRMGTDIRQLNKGIYIVRQGTRAAKVVLTD